MTRTEMVDNLLDSYTIRELRTLANRLGIDLLDNDVSIKEWYSWLIESMIYCLIRVVVILSSIS